MHLPVDNDVPVYDSDNPSGQFPIHSNNQVMRDYEENDSFASVDNHLIVHAILTLLDL